MITIAIVGGVALVVVLVTRGSFSRLFRLPIQSIWMVLVALAIQILLAFVDIPANRLDDLGFGLVMASYAFLLAFCFVNLRISWMWIIGLGIALNALVIGLNQGMPTRDNEVTTRSGRTIEEPIQRTAKHRPESGDDLLPFLGDRLQVPYPVDEVISIGDVVIGLGIILVCYQGSRVRRRRSSSSRSERTARIAQRMRQREREQDRASEREREREREPEREPAPQPAAQLEPLPPVPPAAPPNVKETHVLSHDSADDTLGVELDQVYASTGGGRARPRRVAQARRGRVAWTLSRAGCDGPGDRYRPVDGAHGGVALVPARGHRWRVRGNGQVGMGSAHPRVHDAAGRRPAL